MGPPFPTAGILVILPELCAKLNASFQYLPEIKFAFKIGVFAELIAMAFSLIILVYGGYRITLLAMGQMTSSLGVAVGVFYVAMPVCGVINILYTILNIYDICKGKKEEA